MMWSVSVKFKSNLINILSPHSIVFNTISGWIQEFFPIHSKIEVWTLFLLTDGQTGTKYLFMWEIFLSFKLDNKKYIKDEYF